MTREVYSPPGLSFFRHPTVQVVGNSIAGVFSALVILGSAVQSRWLLACVFAVAEVWFIYALVSVKPRRERAERMRSYLGQQDVHANRGDSSKTVATGVHLLREFRAHEAPDLRRRLQLSLLFAVVAVVILLAVAVGLAQ